MYEQARTLRHSEEDKEERREKKEELGEKKRGALYTTPTPPTTRERSMQFSSYDKVCKLHWSSSSYALALTRTSS